MIENLSFAVISINSLLVYEKKYYLEVYLDNRAFKVANKKMTDYLDDNLFIDQILKMLYYDRIDLSEGIDLTNSNRSK